MLKKKDWKELMQELKNKVDEREQMISNKIDDLRNQGQAVQMKIKENNAQMIEFEMNEDMNSAEKIKKENKQLRLQLEEIQDSISGYENQLGSSYGHYAKDMDKIRVAVNKATEERVQHRKDLSARMDEVDGEIDTLKKEREKLLNEYHFSGAVTETSSLLSYIEYLDPRAKNIDYRDREQFILRWLSGDPNQIESFFKKPEISSGRKVVHVDTSRGDNDWVHIPSGLNI